MAWVTSIRIIALLLLFMGVVVGCENQSDQVQLPGDEVILAKVNGQQISRYDLDSAIHNMLGAQQADLLDAQARKKVLESLVLSRVMALSAENDLAADEKIELDKQVARYREQLLAKAYLTAHAEPQPVTTQMVSDYYLQHPEQFGQKTLYHYEILAGSGNSSGEERKALLTTMQTATSSKDWKILSERWKGEGKKIIYHQAKGTLDVVDQKLTSILKGMDQNQTSNILYQDGVPFVIRLNQKHVVPPRPLSQVSAEVRKSLIPMQLKKQIQKLSDELMKTAEVEYMN